MRKLLVIVLVTACGGRPAPKPAVIPADPDPNMVPDNDERPPPEAPAMPKRPWPSTNRIEVSETVQETKLSDPYRWLEDEKRDDVQQWMKEQDDYTRGELAKLPTRVELADRLKQLYYYDAITAPLHRKGRFFYTRKHADKEKTIVYWKQGESGAEQVLFDPNKWSEEGTTGLGGWWPSHDGTRVAYSTKENNSDETVTHVIDVKTGKHLPDKIIGTKYTSNLSWTPDGKGFYYTWVPELSNTVTIAARPGFAEVRFHMLGTDPALDTIAYPATKNAETFVHGAISEDGHWLVAIVAHGWRSSDIYIKDARKRATPTPTTAPAAPGTEAEWTTLVAGVDASFDISIWRDAFYVRTNDGAPRYRIYKVDPKQPARAKW